MIDRYSLPEMQKIWDLNSKFSYYLNVELAVCKAYVELGRIPKEAFDNIKQTASFDVHRIEEIEAEVRHDVIAFLTNINESVGEELAQYIHMGLTSSDVIDTAFALQIKDSSKIIDKKFKQLFKTFKELALKHKNTVCIGRSHGIHAEVMTFGLKVLNWLDIFERVYKKFEYSVANISVGQISGPVGTYSNLPIELESIACNDLGLSPARISTQVIARDIHADYIQTLALVASVIEQVAQEIRHLQRTEVREVEEGFAKKQKGSSAMPHKKNPVLCENLCGLARVVRGNSIAALENIPVWHERDISHSSVERVIFPDSLILVDFMLTRLNDVLQNLVIKKDNMENNSNMFGGIVYSQRVLLTLVKKGLTREDAYVIVQKHALDAFENNGNFRLNLESDNNVTTILSTEEIEECFDRSSYLKNVDNIFKKFFN
ncbi:MAG: adenylosuccinate lyase [Candidatus Gastranaerophilaceae bacterium]